MLQRAWIEDQEAKYYASQGDALVVFPLPFLGELPPMLRQRLGTPGRRPASQARRPHLAHLPAVDASRSFVRWIGTQRAPSEH